MSLSPPDSQPASPAFLAALQRQAAGRTAVRFDEFMDLALFAPGLGYYTQSRLRVGQSPQADFYTATSLGPLFGELVVAACTHLLGQESPADYTFVEVGAEPASTQDVLPQGVLKGVSHPFGASRTLPLGAPLVIEGPAVVFSNELFDAQPCRRFVREKGTWKEIGVTWSPEGALRETLLTVDEPLLPLPDVAPEGYHLDLPLAAVSLVEKLVASPWHGLFVAIDYGKSWTQLRDETPQGTVRAYSSHRQSNDLLAQPTAQDLTAHVCWDWLASSLQRAGFDAVSWGSQEKFFVQNAGPLLAATMAAEAKGLSQRKLALMQLLHPANLGQKFQVLVGRRRPISRG